MVVEQSSAARCSGNVSYPLTSRQMPRLDPNRLCCPRLILAAILKKPELYMAILIETAHRKRSADCTLKEKKRVRKFRPKTPNCRWNSSQSDSVANPHSRTFHGFTERRGSPAATEEAREAQNWEPSDNKAAIGRRKWRSGAVALFGSLISSANVICHLHSIQQCTNIQTRCTQKISRQTAAQPNI